MKTLTKDTCSRARVLRRARDTVCVVTARPARCDYSSAPCLLEHPLARRVGRTALLSFAVCQAYTVNETASAYRLCTYTCLAYTFDCASFADRYLDSTAGLYDVVVTVIHLVSDALLAEAAFLHRPLHVLPVVD